MPQVGAFALSAIPPKGTPQYAGAVPQMPPKELPAREGESPSKQVVGAPPYVGAWLPKCPLCAGALLHAGALPPSRLPAPGPLPNAGVLPPKYIVGAPR